MSSRGMTQSGGNGVEPFVYRPAIERTTAVESGPAPAIAERKTEEPDTREIEERLRQARQEGYAEAEGRLRAECEARFASVHAAVDSSVAEFARQREDYFSHVEEDVVHLALSIARKILHREAQVDPLLLVGLVHVALDKLDAGTRVRLRLNPSAIDQWREHFRQMEGNRRIPELVADTGVEPDGCVLETEVGTTAIGLETHLKEIEQGFFDLLAQRPR